MDYSNTLLKTFNNSYEDLLIKQEEKRKDIAIMCYCFYVNNKTAINEYIKKYMLDSSTNELNVWNPVLKQIETMAAGSSVGMFSPGTVKIFPKLHFDLVNKILDLTCNIYNNGVERYLVNESGEIDESETQKLKNIYAEMEFDMKIKRIYKQGKLFSTILVQSIWRNDKDNIEIISPGFASVNTDDSDYTNPKEIMISKSIDNEDAVVFWSDSEHYITDIDGDNKRVVKDSEGNDNNGLNPFGELPFTVLRFSDSCDFWGDPQQDLIEQNIWYDIMESNLKFIETFQGLGVGLAINTGRKDVLTISPNTIIAVDDVRADMVTPSLQFTSTGAPLTELKENNDAFYKRIGNAKGLSPQSMNNDVVGQSGIAKMYDSQEMQIKRDQDIDIMKGFEYNFYNTIKIVHNYYSEDKLKDGLTLRINYLSDDIKDTAQIEQDKFDLENNIKSVLDLIIKDNPALSYEEAENLLMENIKINHNGKKETNGNTGTSSDKNTGTNSTQ